MNPNRYSILFITTLASLLTAFSSSSVNVALPAIAGDFHMAAVMLSWVPTSYLLASAVFLIPLGRIADIFGRKKVFTAGIIIYLIASFLCVIASSGFLLLAARILQGLGGSMIFGTSGAILMSVFPIHERGKAIGINTASVYIGLSAGPFLGGILTHYLGWRSIFLASVILAAANLPFIFWKMREEWADAEGESFDLTGSVIYAVSLCCLIAGFSMIPGIIGYVFTGIGLAGIIFFLVFENRASSPILNITLFLQNRVFTFSNLAAMVNYSASFSVSFFMSLYLQYVKGFSPQTAGFILVSQPIVQAVFSPLAGRLSDKIEPRILSSLGMFLTSLGLFMVFLMDRNSSLAWIIGSLAMLGFGFALFSSPNTNAVMSSVEKKFYGTASSILGTMRLTGQMLSMGIATLLIALFLGQSQISTALSGELLRAMKAGFLLFTLLCLAGVYFSLARGNLRKTNSHPE